MHLRPAHTGRLLTGGRAIGGAVGLTRRQVYHAAAFHGLPTFRIGKTIAARENAVAAWLAEREAAGQKTAEPMSMVTTPDARRVR